LFRREQLSAVVERAGALTRRHADDPFGWKALGAALVNMGRMQEALAPLARAVALAPDDVSALSNFGFALQNQRRPIEAQIHLTLALLLKPDFASALVNMGAAMLSQNRYNEAGAFYRRGLAVEPGYVPAYSHLAHVDEEQGRLVRAVAGYRRTLDLLAANPGNDGNVRLAETQAHAHQGVSSVQAKLADFGPVVAQSDAAMALLPDDHGLWEKRLYAFSYHPDLSVEQIFAEFVRWGDRFPAPASDFSRHDRTPGRKLRIGYLSPDFRRHTSRFYFWPLFVNHDPAKVELFAYSNVARDDEFTARFRSVFPHWRDIRQLSDGEAADRIRDDRIDILIDGCNHMRDERLGIFALKPAPIQVTWLGAAWTTGLASVDYVLYDRYLAPPETIARERIVRLPHCFASYEAMTQTDVPRPPPCVRNGYVTFGYSGRTERLNHHTFRAWGDILRRLPDARLVLDFKSFEDPENQQHYRRLLSEQGVDTSRVQMRNSSDIFAGLHDFDMVLDSFPHSGGTMLVDALWMGVPTLTLAGRPPLGRIGSTFLMNLELPEWIARDQAEFVDKAVAFGGDAEGLVRLRAGMRERMLRSPFMDGPAFARAVEWAFNAMWTRYCGGLEAAAIDVPAQPQSPQ
jgi:predicted O-linked N-acetylglucosamine transferase (SPINDLY family)